MQSHLATERLSQVAQEAKWRIQRGIKANKIRHLLPRFSQPQCSQMRQYPQRRGDPRGRPCLWLSFRHCGCRFALWLSVRHCGNPFAPNAAIVRFQHLANITAKSFHIWTSFHIQGDRKGRPYGTYHIGLRFRVNANGKISPKRFLPHKTGLSRIYSVIFAYSVSLRIICSQ